MYVKKKKLEKKCVVCGVGFLGHERHKLCGNSDCKTVHQKTYFNGYLKENKKAIYKRLSKNQKTLAGKTNRKSQYCKNKILWSMKESYKSCTGETWDGGSVTELKAVSLSLAFNNRGKNSSRQEQIIKERLNYERA